MASLAKNKWYVWYLREVSAGHIELPEYDKDKHGDIIIHYGEVFCQVPECSKSSKQFSATNNLRTHISSHSNIPVPSGDKGGRASQEEINQAWYKGLFQGATHSSSSLMGSSARLTPAPAPPADSISRLPLLPRKKDGAPHVTNIRKRAVDLGGSVPCDSCKTKNECCKDIDHCDNFMLFDCGNLAPVPAIRVLGAPYSACG
ncbi:hypothetical protein BDV23DRAFT_177034 [Aspergillus alliaceus]|uniref:C2H2-type domain-containing protein n=1 Tax=Petromyces alliaceus TaxID=209559 RepID=A0A5N7BS15_PETAA|nr:hypothetical protein BDV23DRAFT_177034 [Aspergillus alliaceus]